MSIDLRDEYDHIAETSLAYAEAVARSEPNAHIAYVHLDSDYLYELVEVRPGGHYWIIYVTGFSWRAPEPVSRERALAAIAGVYRTRALRESMAELPPQPPYTPSKTGIDAAKALEP